ncbi:MAG: hypothetical protein WBW26_24735, partial [Bradyrhizobium sp.]|uniref:hypothetical protein n=1 Tax=Bradyrhizobium sp. TaxID=376 RepID=UPI003C36124C
PAPLNATPLPQTAAGPVRSGSDENPYTVRQSMMHLPSAESTQRLTAPESPINTAPAERLRPIRLLLGVALAGLY